MPKTITLFMWAYQHVARLELKEIAWSVFKALGRNIEPAAFLVGIRVPEVKLGYPVCVEPEDGEWNPELFFGCSELAQKIYDVHPDHNLCYGDAPSMRDKPENIRKKSTVAAVQEVLTQYDSINNTISYCTTAIRISNYHVVPVLQMSKSDLCNTPRIGDEIIYGDYKAYQSFLDAVISSIFTEAARELSGPDPGRFSNLNHADVSGILRRAAENFCYAISLSMQSYMHGGLYNNLNVISSLRYEGNQASGSIVFVKKDSSDVDVHIRFNNPISIKNYGLVRKIVEMTDTNLVCIYDGEDGIIGLGSVHSSDCHCFRASFTEHYTWELYYGQLHILSSAFGIPSLPLIRLDKEAFISNAARVLHCEDKSKLEKIWQCVLAAMDQKHGTMIVVSTDSAGEATRLARQSIQINPIDLTPATVSKISGIDGAILISTDCVCHAIGVILDGLATEYGDPSRGARFNSAIRYTNSTSNRTLCVVISEDGNIDMIPHLRPQVSRAKVQCAVNALKSLNHDNYHKTRNWLDIHRFYLSQEQCDTINEELHRIDNEERELGEIRICLPRFKPHPDMNESYFME